MIASPQNARHDVCAIRYTVPFGCCVAGKGQGLGQGWGFAECRSRTRLEGRGVPIAVGLHTIGHMPGMVSDIPAQRNCKALTP